MSFPEWLEFPVRLGAFAGVFMLMAALEAVFPRKQRTQPRLHRWLTNWSLVVVNTMTLRLFVPLLAVGTAELADQNGWGLLAFVGLPFWIEVVLAVVVLDLMIYLQHVAFHKFSFLWQFHKVHHADRDIDVTTGSRFHPVEIVLSMVFKMVCVVALGPAAIAVILFEVILNASSMFNHANVRLPLRLDRVVRWLIVTPDMHRVHHSEIVGETHSNFGFFLAIWDRQFKTYVAQPERGHDDMTIGLPEYQDKKPNGLAWVLFSPFRGLRKQADGPTPSSRLFTSRAYLFGFASFVAVLTAGALHALEPKIAKIHKRIEAKYDNVQHISAEDFSSLNSDDIVVFDVREKNEYQVSHIEGAVRVDPDISSDQFEQAYGGLLSDKIVVFYCSVGRRSSDLASRVNHIVEPLGADASYNLTGGLFQWRNESRPLTQEGNVPTDGIHPYNRYWGRLITDKSAIRYEPLDDQQP